MTERTIIIEQIDPQTFYGVNNSNINLIKNLFPKLRMGARGNVIKVIGEDSETAEFERKMHQLEAYGAKYNKLTADDITDIIKGDEPKPVASDGVILFGQNGRPISPRNANQKRMVKSFADNDLTFALGPAGTGKTYIAIALAVSALKNKHCKRIILSRPAVEAGEKLGFLPGDLAEKVNPYLRPLHDALLDMLGPQKMASLQETGIIEVAPLAFMRGRTLNDAFIILDEAQNTTREQMKMFLTRLGFGSRAAITGDITQIDLPAQGEDSASRSGLVHALHVLKGVKGVAFRHFTSADVVRHPLVGRIVQAYDDYEKLPSSHQ